ncbi:MAG: hypothetical protein AAF333_07990 [Planctomycetota bacterium]
MILSHLQRRILGGSFLAWAGLLLTGCVSPSGHTAGDQRQEILRQHEAIVSEFVAEHPYGRKQLDHAAGYATTTNLQTQVLFVGAGNGYGVAVRGADGKKTFLKSKEIAGGPGVGIASYRTLLVFRDDYAYDQFVRGKWIYQAEADATAQLDGAGGGAQATAELHQPVTIYHMSGSGLQAKATLGSVKFEPDYRLNGEY